MAKVGGKRPGAGRPVGARNKVCEEAKLALDAMARELAPTALETLKLICEKGESEAARVSAATAILDRGFGKPRQQHEHTGKDGADLADTIDEIGLARRVAFILARAAAAQQAPAAKPNGHGPH